MDFDEAYEYITKLNKKGIKLGLSNISSFLGMVNNPQKRMKFVHVAGTNGKGSISAVIQNILIKSGYKVGLFTSPHIYKINERLKINDSFISDEEFAEIVDYLKTFNEKMENSLTSFEFLTAMAFEYFSRKNCDIAVLEVGLGGRLDSTNVIDAPEIAVIAKIGFDHMDKLGDTIEQIAAEKAGIIKENSSVVLYDQEIAVKNVVRKKCAETNSKLYEVDFSQIKNVVSSLDCQTFDYGNLKKLRINLLGTYEIENATTAIIAALVLQEKGYKITEETICAALCATRWPSRFEIIRKNPYVIIDGGHNPQCIDALVKSLEFYFPGKKIIFVVGFMKDKNHEAMVQKLLPLAKFFYTVKPDPDRGLDADELASYIKKFIKNVAALSNPPADLKNVINSVDSNDVICIAGSLYLASEFKIRETF